MSEANETYDIALQYTVKKFAINSYLNPDPLDVRKRPATQAKSADLRIWINKHLGIISGTGYTIY